MVAVNLAISGTLSIILGLLVLLFPKILRIGLGLYFLIIGILSFIQF